MVERVVIQSPPTPSVDPNAPPAAPTNPATPPAPAAGERPGWLPEKFKSPEELAKAYDELSKKLGTQPETPPVTPPADPAAVDPAAAEKQAQEAVAAAGLDFAALSTEYNADGKLGEESYAKLAKAGIPKEMVDAYIEGQQALVESRQQAAFAAVGGEEVFGQMQQWAVTALTPAEKVAYNTAVNSGDQAQVLQAVLGLKAKHEAAFGKDPVLLSGTGPAGAAAYRSWAEVTRDMKDPRYSTDAAYRDDVARKLANSAI